ncbi:cupin domain-containing protein [Flexivirga meconopsidis]|uniref:cupin domain-containing protein n=1 Tax=Flexivirga meconopsidis TaxID=2977121 RepID=UPI00223FD479|nr:cupin domain-containing protein [Flexivirga meconopsidis]
MTASLPSWAQDLGLQQHPEGGWYAETYRHTRSFTPGSPYDGARSLGTGIHFLLLPGESSAWHRVRSDELWLWHRGGPLTISLGGDGESPGTSTELTLGPSVEDGQQPQALVPGGHWQAARPASDELVLVSCIVIPGFDFADFELQG